MPPRLILITPERSGLDEVEMLLPAASLHADQLVLRWPNLSLREVSARLARLATITPRPPLSVHGRFELAIAHDLEGVQLPERALPAEVVRRAAPRLRIGVSRHDLSGLRDSGAADFALLSPFEKTLSKPGAKAMPRELFAAACAASPIPVLALGGIDERSAGQAILAGASGVATIRGVFGREDPQRALAELRQAVDESIDGG